MMTKPWLRPEHDTMRYALERVDAGRGEFAWFVDWGASKIYPGLYVRGDWYLPSMFFTHFYGNLWFVDVSTYHESYNIETEPARVLPKLKDMESKLMWILQDVRADIERFTQMVRG